MTGVCGTDHVELVRSLGADEVVDYRHEDFTKNGQTYDAIIDAVGKYAFRWGRRSIKPGGIYVATDVGPHPFEALFMVVATRWVGSRRLNRVRTRTRDDILCLKELVEAGAYRPVIDRSIRWSEAAEAHRYVEGWHKTGNVVLTIDSGPTRAQPSRQNWPVSPRRSRIAWFCSRVWGRQSGARRSPHQASANWASLAIGIVAPGSRPWSQAWTWSSDRKSSIVLHVYPMSAHHSAAGTRTWKTSEVSSGCRS